jgi:hypothetical protein
MKFFVAGLLRIMSEDPWPGSDDGGRRSTIVRELVFVDPRCV